MAFGAILAVIAFFTVGFYLLRWVQRKSTEIRVPRVADGQWDPLVANLTQGTPQSNPYKEEYEKLVRKVEADPASAASQRTALAQALMRRAMFDVEQAMTISEEKSTLQSLMRAGSIGEDVWQRFLAAESMMGEELGQVGREAENLKPGWSSMIFQQAQQLLVAEKRKQAEAERAEEEQARARLESQMSSDSVEDIKRQEREAERLAQELIRTEEEEKRRQPKNTASGSVTKRKSK